MAARPRKPSRKGWPHHLYSRERETGTHYFWQHPTTGKRYSLGRDFSQARIQAIEANVKLSGMSAAKRLVDLIADEGAETVSQFLPVYRQIVAARGAKPNTLKTLDTNLRRIDDRIGHMVIRRVTTQDINDHITEPLNAQGKARAAAQVASILSDIWKEAAGKGKVSSNPMDSLRVAPVKVKRERWTLDTFLKAYEAAQTLPDKWVARCMKLALITGQPRECLVALEFGDIRDGCLWVERGKTGARIKIPLALTLPELGWNLGDALKECRDNILSRHVLHHNVNRTKAAPGDPIALNGASKGVQRARELAGLKAPDGKLPPTLHEIRSLSIRLYSEARGKDFAQRLAGHKDGSTTDIYNDSRGAEWIEVRA